METVASLLFSHYRLPHCSLQGARRTLPLNRTLGVSGATLLTLERAERRGPLNPFKASGISAYSGTRPIAMRKRVEQASRKQEEEHILGISARQLPASPGDSRLTRLNRVRGAAADLKQTPKLD